MITGLSGMALYELIAAQQQSVSSLPISRDTQPMPGKDSMQFSDQGRAMAASAASQNLATDSPVAELTGNEFDPKEMLQHLRNSFFSRSGDDAFDSEVDLNTDGVINFTDLAMLQTMMETSETRPALATAVSQPPSDLAQVAEPVSSSGQPLGTATIDMLRHAFFSSSGDTAFNETADLNNDGRIDFADLADLADLQRRLRQIQS